MSTPAVPTQEAPVYDELDTMIAMAGTHDGLGDFKPERITPTEENKPVIKELSGEEVVDDPAKQLSEEKPEEKPVTEVEGDDVDQYLRNLDKADKVLEPLSDESKAAFKARLGTDDPDTFVREHNSLKEQLDVANKAAAEARAVKDRFDTMPYELAKALQAVADGKPWKPFLEQLANGITLSKAGKDIDQDVLMDHYGFSKKFNAEQLEAIKSGEADDATKGLYDEYLNIARGKHDESRVSERTAIKDRQEAEKAMVVAHEKATTAAIAHLKTDPAISVFAKRDVIEKFTSGELANELFYNADGTPKPDSLALMLRAMRHDEIVQRVRKGALAEGKAAAEAKAHSKLPGTPDNGAGQRGDPKAKKGAPNDMSDLASMMGLPDLSKQP